MGQVRSKNYVSASIAYMGSGAHSLKPFSIVLPDASSGSGSDTKPLGLEPPL